MSCLYVCCDILVRNGEKDKKKIEKEREKREAYISTMAPLFILSLPLKSFWFFFCLCFLLWHLKDYMIYTLIAVIIFASSIVHHHSLDLKAIGHQTVTNFQRYECTAPVVLSCLQNSQRQRAAVCPSSYSMTMHLLHPSGGI